MTIRVRLFAMQRQQLGVRELSLEVTEGSTVAAAFATLAAAHPVLAPAGPTLRFAVNARYADPDTILAAGDELALIPPVAGGAETDPGPAAFRRIELSEAPFDDALLARLRREVATDADGAVLLFLGQTRSSPGTPAPGQEIEADRHAGRAVQALDYEAFEAMAKVATPGQSTCEQVATLLGLPLARTVKCLMAWADGRVHMLLVRGDHMGNEVKIGKLDGMDGWRWANDAEIVAATGCKPGYLGPVGIPRDMPLVVDRAVAAMSDFVCGANEPDFHLRGVNFGRDCREPDVVADIRNVVVGDPSPDGCGTLDIVRGIEVGHVFALGHLYSQALGATYLAADGQSKVLEMGCYGIGVTRVVAAAIEQNHDDRGIVWPEPLAPFAVAIAPVGYDRNDAVRALADRLHDELTAAGLEVLLDDRGERPGVMFADLELIGIPHRITIGDRGLKEGRVEYQGRRDAAATPVPVAEIATFVKGRLAGNGTNANA